MRARYLIEPEEFGQIVVRSNPDGSVVRLHDIARIELGALNYQQIARVNGQPGCIIAVFHAPGSNALAVASGVKKTLAELKNRFPADLDYAITLDTTLPITEGMREIIQTLVEAMVLVLLVVFFLQSWRATLIPMIAVPVSLSGAFALFPLLGFWINTLALFGITDLPSHRRMSFAAAPPADPTSLADLQWFEVFNDEQLQALIRTALVAKYDLRDAVARVSAARATLGITQAEQFPQIAASAVLTITRSSRSGAQSIPTGIDRDRTVGSVLLHLLSFEVDIWGRLRRATEAARAEVLAAEENRYAVITTLVSDVATAYFNLLALDLELEIARRTLVSRENSLRLISTRPWAVAGSRKDRVGWGAEAGTDAASHAGLTPTPALPHQGGGRLSISALRTMT